MAEDMEQDKEQIPDSDASDDQDVPAATASPSEETSKPISAPPSPPDGGLQAWLHVAGSFMLYFNTWGILNAFGVYQTYYASGALFDTSSSDISWIGSLAAFMLLITGCVAGPIYDRGYLRALLIVGSFLVVFGNMMLSLCKSYWQVVLAQGITIGLGTGILFIPCVAVLPQYFKKKLGLAVGIAAVGSSLGGIIYPIVLYRLINTIGFSWATRVIGFIAMGTLLIPISLLRLRAQPPKIRSIIDWSAFKDIPFMVFCLTSLVVFQGLFCILFYLSYYADEQHLTSTELAFYLVPIFNAGSCFGRSIPNALSDKTGPFNLIAPGAFISGILMLCMMAVTNAAGIIVIAVLAGFMSGVLIALPPVCLVALTKDMSKIGTRIGMGMAILGLGTLSGGPGSGSILGSSEPLNWTGVWVYGGVSCCVAGLGYAALRIAKFGWRLNVKA